MANRNRVLRSLRFVSVTVVLAGAVTACGDSLDEVQPPNAPGAGVSNEDMVGEATPMTLEEAESLGIVDTTVRVAPPVGPDSLPLYNPTAPSGDSPR